VSIPGATPDASADRGDCRGLVARKKYVYLCTNGLLLKEKIDQFKPASNFSFVVPWMGTGTP